MFSSFLFVSEDFWMALHFQESNEFKLLAVIENLIFVFSWFTFGKLPRIITLNTFSYLFYISFKEGYSLLQSPDDYLLNGWASVEHYNFYSFYNLRKNNMYVFLKLLPYLLEEFFSLVTDTYTDRSCHHAVNSSCLILSSWNVSPNIMFIAAINPCDLLVRCNVQPKIIKKNYFPYV